MSDTFSGFGPSISAMSAERKRMQVISSNIANATTVDENGPYVRKSVVFEEILDGTLNAETASGVRMREVYEDHASEFPRVFEPGHIGADKDGYVRYPNVNISRELVDLMISKRSYGANVAAFQTWRAMVRNAISTIGAR